MVAFRRSIVIAAVVQGLVVGVAPAFAVDEDFPLRATCSNETVKDAKDNNRTSKVPKLGHISPIPGKPGEEGALVGGPYEDDKNKNKIELWCVLPLTGKHGGPDLAYLFTPKGGKGVWIGACTLPEGNNSYALRYDKLVKGTGVANGVVNEFTHFYWKNFQPDDGTNKERQAIEYLFEVSSGNITQLRRTTGKFVTKDHPILKGQKFREFEVTKVEDANAPLKAPEDFKELKLNGEQLTVLNGEGFGVQPFRVALVAHTPAGRFEYALVAQGFGGTGTEADPFRGPVALILPGDTLTLTGVDISMAFLADEATASELGGWEIDASGPDFVSYRATSSARLAIGVTVPGFGFVSDAAVGTVPWGLSAADASAGSAGTTAGPVQEECSLDVDGDDEPDVTLPNVDRNGFCEFPDGKTVLRGTLHATPDSPIEFSGTTLVEADAIVIDEGAVLRGDPERLRSLGLVALDGDLVSGGRLEVRTSDDLILRARAGAITLDGNTTLAAADRLALDARAGSITIAGESGALLGAGNRVDLTAKSGVGGIDLDDTFIGSRRITIDTAASTSAQGPKAIRLVGDTLLTTDPQRIPLSGSSSDVVLKASLGAGMGAAIVIADRAAVASGRNVVLATQKDGNDACLADEAALRARGGTGFIDFLGVRGLVRKEGSATLLGQTRGAAKLVAGACP